MNQDPKRLIQRPMNLNQALKKLIQAVNSLNQHLKTLIQAPKIPLTIQMDRDFSSISCKISGALRVG